MNKLFQRNLVKNKIQDYILNFIYNQKNYIKLIFTGGTSLQKLYGLPRLSEDLDLDYREQFNIIDFDKKIKRYFRSVKEMKLTGTKIATHEKTIFLKFLGSDFLPANIVNPQENIFVRCDFSPIKYDGYQTEVVPYSSASGFNFFILTYDLPTIMANKIAAFLQRNFFKGSRQSIPFKARDLFDIFWFIGLSSQSGFKLQPNWTILQKNFPGKTKSQIISNIIKKTKKISPSELRQDLQTFIQDKKYLDDFLDNYKTVIQNKLVFFSNTK